jgi:hypothetical protein
VRFSWSAVVCHFCGSERKSLSAAINMPDWEQNGLADSYCLVSLHCSSYFEFNSFFCILSTTSVHNWNTGVSMETSDIAIFKVIPRHLITSQPRIGCIWPFNLRSTFSLLFSSSLNLTAVLT